VGLKSLNGWESIVCTGMAWVARAGGTRNVLGSGFAVSGRRMTRW
jgi:hypothetical protein